MSIDFTVNSLISTIRDKALLPNSQLLYQPSDLVNILTRELLTDIVPLLMAEQQEYLVVDYDQAINTSQNSYLIPTRAVGVKLRDVVLVDNNNFERNMPRLQPEFTKGLYVPFVLGIGFFVKNNSIVIYPNTSTLSPYTLRMKYYRRPNNLALTSDCGQITAIDTNTNTLTLANLPAAWTLSTTFDFIQNQPPFMCWAEDQTITALTSNTLTFTNSLPDNLSVGDWVAEAGYSPIAQIPYEAFPLLAQRAVIEVLAGMNDSEGLKQATDIYQDMVQKFKDLVAPRVDGSIQKINTRSGLINYTRALRFYSRY